MENGLWSPTFELFQEVDRLLEQFEKVGALRTSSSALVAAGAGAGPRSTAVEIGLRPAFRGVDEQQLVRLRSELRARLERLRTALAEQLTEREIYLALFPIVLYLDEQVQRRLLGDGQTPWPPLQKELYQIDEGGEMFYQVLDDLLRKPSTLPFIYELYYFCLSDGFRGRYADNPSKINEYKTRLADRIPRPRPERPPAPAPVQPVWYERVPLRHYAAAALVVLLVYGLLRLAASL
ncbi:MAG: hypothetical protein D6776_10200 [Planctomycetota bacterium]|nr:MAG: hypothetical protein D6776_10200 [Planctomycetota bacterium]